MKRNIQIMALLFLMMPLLTIAFNNCASHGILPEITAPSIGPGADIGTESGPDGVGSAHLMDPSVDPDAMGINGTWKTDMVTQAPMTACSGTSFTVSSPTEPPAEGKSALEISSRTIVCGSTMLVFPAVHMNVDSDGKVVSGGNIVGKMTANGLTVTQSKSVPRCGVVNSVFKIEQTAGGTIYSETYTTPCIGAGKLFAVVQ